MQAIHQRALPLHAALDDKLGTSISFEDPGDEFLQRLRQRRVLTARFVVDVGQPRRQQRVLQNRGPRQPLNFQ